MKKGNTLKTLHTPGPWIAYPPNRDKAQIYYHVRVGEDEPQICVAHNEADCRLIAAAPELLEALQIVLDGNSKLDPFAEKTIRAAIAKAQS